MSRPGTHTSGGRRGTRASGRLGAALLLAVVLALVPAAPAVAQQVTLVTPYPAVDVEPGERVDFDLEVRSDVTQRVDLTVTDAPEGWGTRMRGGGFAVNGVTAGPDSPGDVDLGVEVPAEASEGTHGVTVVAEGRAGGRDVLELELTVAESVAGAVTFETEFPRLRGAADDTYRFDLTLRNERPEETTFALSGQGPQGWDVSAQPQTESRATTVTVEGGGTATVNVEADPPDQVTAGEYQLLVEASGGGQRARQELTVEIAGSVSMAIETPNQRLNASGSAGSPTRVPLVVRNTGSAPLRDVSLQASPPANWEVQFEPESVPAVAPGESAQVTAVVTPADQAVVGDYMVTMTSSAAGRSSSVDVRFTVETPLAWGAVGAVAILAALLALVAVFRRFGRR